jgi:hypothetical protein
MTISEWHQRFTASASEILDLLDLTRTRRRSLLRNLLENGTISIDVQLEESYAGINTDALTLTSIPDAAEPAPLGVFSGMTLLGTVRSSDHADVSTILETGLELEFELVGTTLHISAVN